MRNNRAVVGEFPRLLSSHDLKAAESAREVGAREQVVGGEEPGPVGWTVAMPECFDVPAARPFAGAVGKWASCGLRLLQKVDQTERVNQRQDGFPTPPHYLVIGLIVDVEVATNHDPAVELGRIEERDEIGDGPQDRGLRI